MLVDDSGKVAEGKALDIRQAAPVDGYSTFVAGTADESAVIAADAVVIADPFSSAVEWQGDAGVVLTRRLHHLNSSALFLAAGAQQLEMVERSVREGGINRRQLLGSAPEGLRSSIVSMAALEAQCAPTEISLTVVGRPPSQIIVPWDDASIGGRRATDVLSAPAITRLDARLARLWPPGPFTLASAATQFLRAAATRSHRTLSAFVAVAREEGDSGRVGMLPVSLDERGIRTVVSPTLTARDRVRLDTALHR